MEGATATGRLPRRADEPTVDWRAVLPTIVAVFLATRALVVLVALVLEGAVPVAHAGETWSTDPVLRTLTGHDAVFYLGIAEAGYHLEPVKEGYRDWVFFPLYPLLVRAVSLVLGGHIALAALLVSNLAFLGATLLLHRLSVRHLEPAAALRSVVYLAIAPGAVAFALAYAESLFLLLSLGAFLAAERRRWAVMAALYALAAVTRLPGVLLGLPLLVLMLRDPGLGSRRSLLWLLAGPAALAAFSLYLGATVGDPLGYVRQQGAWALEPLLGGEPGATDPSGAAPFNPLPLLLVATLLFHVFLLVYLRPDRVPLPYALLAVVSLLTVIGSMRLQSVARYLVVAWPFAWLLARREAPAFRHAWPVVSAGLFVLHAFLHLSQALAP